MIVIKTYAITYTKIDRDFQLHPLCVVSNRLSSKNSFRDFNHTQIYHNYGHTHTHTHTHTNTHTNTHTHTHIIV